MLENVQWEPKVRRGDTGAQRRKDCKVIRRKTIMFRRMERQLLCLEKAGD